MSNYVRGVRPKAVNDRKDRAGLFSRKHRRYWLTITGGMILIGAINLGLGFCGYEEPPTPEKIELVLPKSIYEPIDAGVIVDGPDAQRLAPTPETK